MPRSMLSIPKFTYDIYGKRNNKRKAFKISTKKMEWMSAAGKDPLKWKTNFVKMSKCRVRKCKRPLTWGDRSYEFDHKDNNSSNNSQRNCYLVCRICHGKATIFKKKKIMDKLTGITIGHKVIKKKVGYKKSKRKKIVKKKSTKRKSTNPFRLQPIRMSKFEF